MLATKVTDTNVWMVPHDSIRQTPGRFQEVGTYNLFIAQSQSETESLHTSHKQTLHRFARMLQLTDFKHMFLFVHHLQMWSGLNALNHGATGFLHHDRQANELQGNFGKKGDDDTTFYGKGY